MEAEGGKAVKLNKWLTSPLEVLRIWRSRFAVKS